MVVTGVKIAVLTMVGVSTASLARAATKSSSRVIGNFMQIGGLLVRVFRNDVHQPERFSLC
ncbi:MAG: hypothetical protein MMC33_005907 [Icmadophila ericetorum]|nr:hypothetical protein [Icmadophila ericetorum]